MVLKYLILVIINVIYIKAICDKEAFKTIEWTGGPLVWSDPTTKSVYQNSGSYVSKSMIATRAQIYDDKVFLAVPRFKQGVAATLVEVSLRHTGADATMVPFPCLIGQDPKSPESLQSVVDLFIDLQDVLWALDTGIENVLNNPIRRCAPKVVAFNLKTGRILKSIDLSGLVSENSRVQYLAVDYANDGRPFVYVSDAATRSILVFDVTTDRGYRVVLPKAVQSGCNRRDVLHIALVRKGCGNNYLVFSYLCGKRMFSIRTDYLRSGSTSGRIVDLGIKPNKLVILGTDLGSAIFLRFEGQNEIYRWDTNTCFKEGNFLMVYKSEPGFLTTQVMPDVKRQRMRVLQSNFPDYIANTCGCGAVQQIHLLDGC